MLQHHGRRRAVGRSRTGRYGAAVAAVALALAASAGPALAAPAGPAGFVPIEDGGHPATPQPSPAVCHGTTLAIVSCEFAKTETLDWRIDRVRLRTYRAAGPAGRRAVNRDDAAWVAARSRVCAAVANGGGTIDGIVAVTCDRDESAARLDAVRGLAVPTAHLATTDIDDPEFAAYATTATGTRVGAIDTQGDQTGGIIIDWVVVAGYRGFVVHPAQFAYVDGTFTDPGIVEPGVGGASPAGHRVRPGTVFQFAVDYSTIARDPNGPGVGVYRFRAGATTIGTWR